MGITWIFEAISLVAEDNVFFLIYDIWNTLQGILIFLLFILRRRVIRLIKKRLVIQFRNQLDLRGMYYCLSFFEF